MSATSFQSEVKAVTQQLDSIALSLSTHSIVTRSDYPATFPIQASATVPAKEVLPPSTPAPAGYPNVQGYPMPVGTHEVARHQRQDPSFAEFASQITALSTRLKNALAVETALGVAPTITSVSPPSGPAGTVLTITGTNFGDSPESAVVRIAGISAHANSWSSTKILATVPEGTKKGEVSVTTSGGKSTGAFTFTSDSYVAPAPIIPKEHVKIPA